MTDERRRQLDAVAMRFGTDPRSVYLLAGEVPGQIEYVHDRSAQKARARGRWSGVSRIKPSYERDPNALDMQGLRDAVFDLGWTLA